MRGMLITRAYRLAAQASLLARVYGGYKLIQALGRAGLVEADGHYARHHRRSAEATYRLATRLEGLPIKVCQFLGSRADILPAEYVDVLSALQDRVPPRPLAQLRPYLERELGAPVGDVFTDLDPVPLASASLAQVHRARLRDGRDVAVKIQYPEIADLVAIDLENFALLFGVLARLEPNLDLRVVLEEVQKYVPLELDFCHEAANAERMAEHPAARAADFAGLGLGARDGGDDSVAWLGGAFLGWAIRNGRAHADPEMLARFGAEMPQRLGTNPLVEIPGDVLLVGRVMGLLSGIGKQLGSQADVGAVLLPYLVGAAPAS